MTTEELAWERLTPALQKEVRRAERRDPRLFPHYSDQGRWRLLAADETSHWRDEDYDHGNWTFGFWYGLMWLAATVTGQDTAALIARDRLHLLLPRAHDRTTHDLGFIFWPSLVLGHRLGFVPDAHVEPARAAGHTLADRFNPRGRYLQAFGAIGHPLGAGTSTIDTMMNLPLLWWAGTMGGNERLLDIAYDHAATTRRTFVRDDGSTYHLNRFDPDSGALIEPGTFQGAGTHSCWSRGQAWAICGFALAYAATSDTEMLATAETTAHYFWAHLPADQPPPWDFADDDADAPRDASAAAIAAVGALVLSAVHPDPDTRAMHRSRAAQLLTALIEHVGTEDRDGILQRSSYSVPHRLGMDGATAWGDFYFCLAYALLTERVPMRLILDGPSVSTATMPS